MNVSRQNGQLFAGYQSGKQGWFGETGMTAVGIASPLTPTPPPCPVTASTPVPYRWPSGKPSRAWRT